MRWEGHWWGTKIFAENPGDNRVLDDMLGKLNPIPTYSHEFCCRDPKLEVEQVEGLTVITFNR